MSKSTLIAAVASATSQSKQAVTRSVNAFLGLVVAALTKGKAVRLGDFGTFRVRARKARRGVNPRTRQPIQIPAGKVVRFAPSLRLRKAIR